MKAQSAMEYMATYGWAILIIAVITSILYLYSTTPTTIVPTTCVFISGVYCNAMVVGTNTVTHATTVALFLTNSQPYPIARPYLFAQLNGANTTQAKCSPSYVVQAGSMVCVLNLPTKTALGQFLTGKLYLNATYCALYPNYSRSNLCVGAPREIYAGSFQSHVEPLINTNTTIALTANNQTQAANGAKDPLIATVKLLGYPLWGATVNFTANVPGYTISPNYTTTNSTGKALSYIWGSRSGNVLVTASYAGVNASTVIDFIPAFGVRFSTNWPYCAQAGQIITIDGVAYTCSALTSTTFSWGSNTVHSCAITNPVPVSSGVRGQCSISSGTPGACTASSNATIAINCTSQYLLTTSANPSNAGTVSPPSGWYNQYGTVSISESANSGFNFNGWTGNGTGSYTGASPSASVTMNSPVTETSSYVTNVVFTESGLPSGTSWSVTLNGNTLSSTGTSITFGNLVPGSYSWSTPPSITCGTGCQYSATASSGVISTSSGSAQQGIAYATQYYLTMSSSSGGAVSPSSGWYNKGSQVSITASATSGYFFSGWSGSGAGSYTGAANPGSITVSAPIGENATFVPGYPVTFQESGLPQGTSWSVTLNGQQRSSTNATLTFTNVQVGSYPWSASAPTCGTGCQYSASPSSGTISVDSQVTQQVPYTKQYYLTMVSAGGGSVSPSNGWYASGSGVAITATASSGYHFSSWAGAGSGSYSGTLNPTVIFLSGPVTETASFSQVPQSYEVSLTCAALGQCTCSLSGPCTLCAITYYSGLGCTGSQMSYGSSGNSCYNYDGPCSSSLGSCTNLGQCYYECAKGYYSYNGYYYCYYWQYVCGPTSECVNIG